MVFVYASISRCRQLDQTQLLIKDRESKQRPRLSLLAHSVHNHPKCFFLNMLVNILLRRNYDSLP